MEDAEQMAAARAAMAEAGVPPAVSEYVLGIKRSDWFLVGLMVLPLVLMSGGFAIGASVLWPALESHTEANALAHALEAGAVLHSTNFGMSMLIALFAWMFIAYAAASVLLSLTPELRAAGFVMSAHVKGFVSRRVFRASVKGLDPDMPPSDYVRRVAAYGQRIMLVIGLALVALSSYAVYRDVRTNSVYTPSSYIRVPFFPWGSREARPWADARRVELGCNHVDGDSDSLIYKVHFTDGEWVNLAYADPLPGDDWLTAAEQIDAELAAGGAEFRRWSWMDRDPLHPLCLRVMQQSFGPNFWRIERLLRIRGG